MDRREKEGERNGEIKKEIVVGERRGEGRKMDPGGKKERSGNPTTSQWPDKLLLSFLVKQYLC